MFHLFKSITHSSVWAATDDRSAERLPNSNLWSYRTTVSESCIGFDAKAAKAAIQMQGYYLFTVSIEFTEREVTI